MSMIVSLVTLVVLLGVVALLTEVENFGWATLTLIVSLVGVQFLHVADLFFFVKSHIIETLLGVGVYLIIGIIWSFIKWFSFLHKHLDKFIEAKSAFLKKYNLPSDSKITLDFIDKMNAELGRPAYDCIKFESRLLNKPLATDNKSKIIAWMSLWPFSLIGTIINDPVRRLFTFCFNRLKSFYQSISNHVFKNTELE